MVQHFVAPLEMGYFKARDVEMCKLGYTILEDLCDPLNKEYLAKSGNAELPFDELFILPKETKYRFFRTVQQTFNNGYQSLLWAIFNHAVEEANQADRRWVMVRFQRLGFQRSVFEQSFSFTLVQSISMFPRNIPGSAVSPPVLHAFNNGRFLLPVTGFRFLLIGHNFPSQSAHRLLPRQRDWVMFFIIATGHEDAHLCVLDGWQKGVNYPEKRKRQIA